MSVTQHTHQPSFGEDDNMARSSAAYEPASPPAGPDAAAPGGQPDLAAQVSLERARRRSRARLQRSLTGLLRRGQVARRPALATLLAEDDHIGDGRDPGHLTHAEAVVRAAAKRGADTHLARSQRRLNREARRIDRLRAREAMLRLRANHRQGDLVRHPVGGHEAVGDVQQDRAALRAQIDGEIASGSRKHQRMPLWIGNIPKLVFIFDVALLLYFFAGITDVDWSSPVSMNLAFAALLASMVTTLSYGFLAFTGYRLRGYKDHSGAVTLDDLDTLTRIACWASFIGVLVVATLMFIRMRTEVLYALGPQAGVTALVIALVLAVVSVLANYLVVAVHALDGSDQVARLDSLSAATYRPLSRAHRMREKAALIPHRITVRDRRAHRHAIRAITGAGRHLVAADQVIDAAHAVHQGSGPHSGPAADPNDHDRVAGYRAGQSTPSPDLRPLDTAMKHISTPPPESGHLA
jgi:hypothetical protein